MVFGSSIANVLKEHGHAVCEHNAFQQTCLWMSHVDLRATRLARSNPLRACGNGGGWPRVMGRHTDARSYGRSANAYESHCPPNDAFPGERSHLAAEGASYLPGALASCAPDPKAQLACGPSGRQRDPCYKSLLGRLRSTARSSRRDRNDSSRPIRFRHQTRDCVSKRDRPGSFAGAFEMKYSKQNRTHERGVTQQVVLQTDCLRSWSKSSTKSFSIFFYTPGSGEHGPRC